MNKQLTFELRNKDELGDDMAQRDYVKKKEKLGEGYHAMGNKASYNDNIPAVKIILQHNRKIEEGEQRYRNIAKIFLENQDGERFLAPTTRPGIAQIYARHIAEGGVPNDERWNHVKAICEEYSKMAGFVRAVKNNQFNESAQQLVSEGINHYQSLRETLGRLRGHRGYNMYFESWTPALMEDDTDSNINELFVQETVDPRIESVMPILARLNKNKATTTVKEVAELAEWADSIVEGGCEVEEDLDADQKRVGQLGPTEKVGKAGAVGKLVGANESVNVEDGMAEHEVIWNLINGNLDAYDVMNHPKTPAQRNVAGMMQERYDEISSEYPLLHPDDDFEKILDKLVDELADDYGTSGYSMNEGQEDLDMIKRLVK